MKQGDLFTLDDLEVVESVSTAKPRPKAGANTWSPVDLVAHFRWLDSSARWGAIHGWMQRATLEDVVEMWHKSQEVRIADRARYGPMERNAEPVKWE